MENQILILPEYSIEYSGMIPTTRETRKRSRSGTSSMQNPDMNESVGLHSSQHNLTAKTIIHNEKRYYVHHIHDRFAASKDVFILNLQMMWTHVGILHQNGHYYFTAAKEFKLGEERYVAKRRFYYNHRFV